MDIRIISQTMATVAAQPNSYSKTAQLFIRYNDIYNTTYNVIHVQRPKVPSLTFYTSGTTRIEMATKTTQVQIAILAF